jgi:hypothetical protein
MQGIGVSVRRRLILRMVRVVVVPFVEAAADPAMTDPVEGCWNGRDFTSFIYTGVVIDILIYYIYILY